MNISEKELKTLAAILEQATSSSNDHERLAALGAAARWLIRHDARWSELLVAPASPPRPAPRSYHDSAKDCLATGVATQWEQRFLDRIIRSKHAMLNTYEEAQLDHICKKFGVALWDRGY